MKKQNKQRKPTTGFRRRPLSVVMLVIAASILVGATITVLSKQLGHANPSTVKAALGESGKKYVTVKVAGRDVQVDPQTGQIKSLTPEEAKQLADGLKTMLNKSTEGLVQQQNPDGSVSMNLQGRFQNVTVARVNADGTLEQSCVDEPLAAAQFFGIDPQLVGAEQTKGAVTQTQTQALVKTPARKVSQ